MTLQNLVHNFIAGEIHELREREREAGIKPDLEVDAFMKASVRRGKRYNIRTDYVLRLLGLEVGFRLGFVSCFDPERQV